MSAKTISPGLIKHEIESINAVQRLIGSKRHPLERGSLMREVSAQRCQTLGNFNELCTVSLHLRKSLQWPSPLCVCRLGWRVAAVALVWLLCDVSLSFLSARQLSRYALVICRSRANLPARSLAAHCLCAFSSIYAPFRRCGVNDSSALAKVHKIRRRETFRNEKLRLLDFGKWWPYKRVPRVDGGDWCVEHREHEAGCFLRWCEEKCIMQMSRQPSPHRSHASGGPAD